MKSEPHGINAQKENQIASVLSWMARGTLFCLVAILAWAVWVSWQQRRELAALEADWRLHYPEYTRLSRAGTQLKGLEIATRELEGSWRRTTPIGSLLAQCTGQIPDSSTLGKIELTSTYAIKRDPGDVSLVLEPEHLVDARLAIRCYATPAEVEVLSLYNDVKSDPKIKSAVQSVALEGLRILEGRGDAGDHAVFSISLTLPPRPLSREGSGK